MPTQKQINPVIDWAYKVMVKAPTPGNVRDFLNEVGRLGLPRRLDSSLTQYRHLTQENRFRVVQNRLTESGTR